MNALIQNRRGAYSSVIPQRLLPGEIVVVTSGDPNSVSGKSVYVGTANGSVERLAFNTDVTNVNIQAQQAASQAQEALTNTSNIYMQVQTKINQANTAVQNAQQSATTATSQAQAAQQSANTATSQAQAAQQSATTATTKAEEAEQSKTDAQTASQTASQILTSMIPAYSSSKTYAVGDLVVYNNKVYQCKTAINTPEAWTSSHWTASTVENELANLKDDIEQIEPGLSEDAKAALLSCFRNVAWINEQGQSCYNNLYEALYPDTGLARILAVFTQGSTVIYDDTPLNTLKAYLTVTAYYNNGTSRQISDYSLSGTLTAGTSVVTVSYSGKTTIFNVTVTQRPTLVSIAAVFDQGQNVVHEEDALVTLKQYLTVTATYSDSTTDTVTNYTLSGTLTAGTSTITVTYGEKTTTFTVVVTSDVEPLTATFTPGTHAVYPTDSLDSLKKYLTVTKTTGSTSEVVTNYTLSGTLAIGTSTITVTHDQASTTFDVTVATNVSGILYDWDFTESLTDQRQALTAALYTGESWEIPGKSAGTTPPVQGATGVVFNNAQQLLRLFNAETVMDTFLNNKTIQIDVASFSKATTSSQAPTVRFLMTSWYQPSGNRTNELGLIYADHSTQAGYAEGSNVGWALNFTHSSGAYFNSEDVKSAAINDISGKTVSIYIDSTGSWSMYINNTLLGSWSQSLVNSYNPHIYDLQIGAGGGIKYGGAFYNATISGVRIYNGNIMQQ